MYSSRSLIKERRKALTYEQRKKNHISRVCLKETKNVIYIGVEGLDLIVD